MTSTEKNHEIKSSSFQSIKRLAEFLAIEFSEDVTPLEKIVAAEELDLFYDSYGDTFDGMTVYDRGQFFIHINLQRSNKPGTTRARFTIAHELGHYFIDNHRIGLRSGLLTPHFSINNENTSNRIEREADYFASCLLMPEVRFKKFIHRRKFDFSIIKEAAEHFNTSITATAIRFSAIGNHPLMIVFSELGRIRWKWASPDFPYQYLLYTNKVPENSVMGEYFSNGIQVNSTEEVWGIDWFSGVSDRDLNLKFLEHCITHKNFALSIIWEK
jgi:Zn-dependent peptidase ImmA (M78 family)